MDAWRFLDQVAIQKQLLWILGKATINLAIQTRQADKLARAGDRALDELSAGLTVGKKIKKYLIKFSHSL